MLTRANASSGMLRLPDAFESFMLVTMEYGSTVSCFAVYRSATSANSSLYTQAVIAMLRDKRERIAFIIVGFCILNNYVPYLDAPPMQKYCSFTSLDDNPKTSKRFA